MANDLKFSVTFDAVTASFNGAITQSRTAFNAAVTQMQADANKLGASTATAGQQTTRAMQDAAKSTDQLSNAKTTLNQKSKASNDELARSKNITDQLGGSWSRLATVMATFGIGVSAKDIIELADAYKNLQAVIKLASGQGDAFVTAFEGVREIANSTFTSLSQTADLFRKVTEATRVMGTTQAEVLDITRTVNQAVQLSGASAGGAAGAILQFNQALSSGRLSGQEFNSVSEQAPRLLKVFTDALGISIGELRKLAFSQKLTSDILLESLESQADKVNAEFATLPLTVGRSLTTLKNQLIDFIGEADAANKVTEQIAKAVIFLSNNLDTVAAALKFAVQAAIAFKLVDLATSMFAKATAATAAAAALRTQAASIAQGTVATASNSTTQQANTAATNTNTSALGANGAAARAAAAGKTSLAASNTAAATSSAALNRNIGGGIPNLNAAGAAAASMGAKLVGALSIAGIVYLAISMLKQVGEGIAALAAKATGLDKAIKDGDKAWEDSEKRVKEIQEAYKLAADNAVLFAERQAGLSKESAALTGRFDDLTKAGKTSAQAINELGKELKLDDLTGINNAVTALNGLALQGKISGDQARQSLQDSLADIDLTAFQANAVAAFGALNSKVLVEIDKLNAEIAKKQADLAKQMELSANASSSEARILASKAATALEGQISEIGIKISGLRGQVEQEVQKMAIVQDTVLNEAIRRTGISLDVLKGQYSAASRSATNDVQIIIDNMSELQKQGVNTGLALGGALSRAIDEANTQEALQAVSSKVTSLKAQLGEKVVDGLLNEAALQSLKLKDSLDDATAGVNSVREAFREFGLKTRDEYQAIADRQKAAFDQMIGSGQATTEQLATAFGKYAESAIAANGGVADGFVSTQAAALGMEVTTDKTGKTAVKSMDDAKDSTDKVTRSVGGAGKAYKALGDAAEDAGNRAVQSIEEQVAATRKLSQEKAKARDEQLSKERGATVNSVDNLAGVGIMAYSVDNIVKRLISELGYDNNRAAVEARRIMDGYVTTENNKGFLSKSLSNAGYVDAELQRLAQYTQTGKGLGGTLPAAVRPKTTNVNITAGGKSVSANVPSDQESDFLSILEQSQRLT